MFEHNDPYRIRPYGQRSGRLGTWVPRSPQEVACGDPEVRSLLEQAEACPALNATDEVELGRRIQAENCPESRDRMFRANLRLVVGIARNYSGRGLSLADIIREGNVGLLRAIETFDPAQGMRFSTHAGWWIKQAIRTALLTSQERHAEAVPAKWGFRG